MYMQLPEKELKEFLEFKYDQYNRKEFIENDPISIPHRYSRKEDIEIAAFLTATLSWGKRSLIIKSSSRLMNLMDDSPWQFINNCQLSDLKKLSRFVHRTFNGTDCQFFIQSLKNIYSHHGGLEKVFSEPILFGKTIKESIIHFRNIFLVLPHDLRLEKHIANPTSNASAKRINMFLRWMVRKDDQGVDFGLWNSIQASQLLCPLDVHTGNVSRKLGLLCRNTNDWKSVEELTDKLRIFDDLDPVKYDFALFGLGINERF
jgi:uncharacterized protein (TIGR02757 family)